MYSAIWEWEDTGRRARGIFESWGNNLLDLKIVAIRRGREARGLDDKTKEHCILEGPMQPHPDFDGVGSYIPHVD